MKTFSIITDNHKDVIIFPMTFPVLKGIHECEIWKGAFNYAINIYACPPLGAKFVGYGKVDFCSGYDFKYEQSRKMHESIYKTNKI